MRQIWFVAFCCALVASVLAGASLAGAEEPTPEPTPSELEGASTEGEPTPPATEETSPAAEEASLAIEEDPSYVIEPISSGEMSTMSLSQCSANQVCAWANSDFTGNFSWWAASNTGCHNHAGNPYIRSGYNRTGYNVRYGGGPTLPPGYAFQLNPGENPITGQICWPV
jgi:hypothetical protein